jgi:hypothetical protein
MSTVKQLLPQLKTASTALCNTSKKKIAGSCIINNRPVIVVGNTNTTGKMERRKTFPANTYAAAWVCLANQDSSEAWEIVDYATFMRIHHTYLLSGL